MNVTEHLRPGVYSVYDASSAASGKTGGGAVGVVGMCTKGTSGKIYPLNDAAGAEETFGEDESLTKSITAVFANGASKVYAVPVATVDGYDAAFAALEEVDDVAVVVSGSDTAAVQKKLCESVKRASANRRERLAVFFGGSSETVSSLVSRAAGFNSERAVVVAPGGALAAAALAGAIAGETDPAMPLGGVELKGVSLSRRWSDNELDSLIRGGVTPLELSGGTVSVVRAVTTRTTTGAASDTTWRELSTIRVVDDVVPGLRNALRAKFARAKNTPQGRGAIRSQVIVELENKLRQEIITGYDDVTVSALDSDPTVCLVEFRFTVTHGLNQIWLSAHITV